MQSVEAVFQNGVFKPLGEVDLTDNQRVWLTFETPARPQDILAWLEKLKAVREMIAAKYGIMDDSTLLIAEDRRRDV